MHLGIAASKLALTDAKLESSTIQTRNRFGILIATAIGGSEFYEEASEKWARHSTYNDAAPGAAWGDAVFAERNSVYKGPEHMAGARFTFEGFKKISPFIVPAFIMNSGSGVAAVELVAHGPHNCYGGEGTAGALSIGQGYRFLSTGEADVMIAGGSESCLTPCVVAGLNQLGTVASGFNDRPTEARYAAAAGPHPPNLPSPPPPFCGPPPSRPRSAPALHPSSSAHRSCHPFGPRAEQLSARPQGRG